MAQPIYDESVFINCPFDPDYHQIFQALIFTVYDCGYIARCSLEIDDASQVRIDKIARIINESKFGIHDLSRTQLDRATKLPRFNMPLELGMFLGAKRFGNKIQKTKVCLILDAESYRYQRFISDISGQDIRSHEGNPENAVILVRDWLSASTHNKTIPGGMEICRRYRLFLRYLPKLCKEMQLNHQHLTFQDYTKLVTDWLKVAG